MTVRGQTGVVIDPKTSLRAFPWSTGGLLSLNSSMEELADQHISTQRLEHFVLLINNKDC